MLDIEYRFTCGDSDLSEIMKKCQNIMTRIAVYMKGTSVMKELKLSFPVELTRLLFRELFARKLYICSFLS